MEYITLGRTNIKISKIGIGTWQWGDPAWGYGKAYTFDDLKQAFELAIDGGINFFDTAEIYGNGKSEKILGELSEGIRDQIVIATKVWPFNLRYKKVFKALEGSLSRLKTDYVDLYYIHWPNPLVPLKSIARAFNELYEANKIRAMGVSNFDLKKMIKFDELVNHRLSANQVKYSLLHRDVEKDLFPYCLKNDITLVAYSPIDQGAISGKYDENNLPRDLWRRMNPLFTKKNMRRIKPLLEALKQLSEQYGVNNVNIVLRYLIKKGAVPIIGVKNRRHVESLLKTFDFDLKDNDMRYLEEILKQIKLSKIGVFPQILVRIIKG